MMSKLRDMEHREMVDELTRKISQLEAEVRMQRTSVSIATDQSASLYWVY